MKLFNEQYEPEVLRTIFPKKGARRSSETVARVLRVADQLKYDSTLSESQRALAIHQLRTEAAKVQADAPIRRFDGHMVLKPGLELLIDQTSVHHSADAYVVSTLKYVRDIHRQERASGGLLFFNKGKTSSSAVIAGHREKLVKYAPVMDLFRAQLARHARDNVPTFLAPVISQLGEMSADAFKLFEIMSTTYQTKIDRNRHFVGITPGQARARYRSRLITATMVNLAVGLGKQLTTMGSPVGKRRSNY